VRAMKHGEMAPAATGAVSHLQPKEVMRNYLHIILAVLSAICIAVALVGFGMQLALGL
jgi:hypothetical protein